MLFTTILGLLLPAQALARWPALTAVSKSSGPTPYGRAWKQCAVLAVSNAMTERGEWSGNVEVDGGELVEMEGVVSPRAVLGTREGPKDERLLTRLSPCLSPDVPPAFERSRQTYLHFAPT